MLCLSHCDRAIILLLLTDSTTNKAGVLQTPLNLRWVLLLLRYSGVNVFNPDINIIAVMCGLDVYLSVRDFV